MTHTLAPTHEITVTVNGEARRLAPGTTLGGLLRAHELDPRMIVVEHNRVILRDRGTFDALPLAGGDSIEIVHFVGGG
jgi:thiamine biosynthesis protein ThiS